MLLFFIISCNKKQADLKVSKNENLNPNIPGYTLDKSPITLDWYIDFNWFKTKWGQDMVSKQITKDTGITINFIAPAGDPNAKLNTMIAGGELPDLITMPWYYSQINDMIDGKLIYPLDELAKSYDPYYFKVAKKQSLGWYTKKDGHVYEYPNQSWTTSDVKRLKNSLTSGYIMTVRKTFTRL